MPCDWFSRHVDVWWFTVTWPSLLVITVVGLCSGLCTFRYLTRLVPHRAHLPHSVGFIKVHCSQCHCRTEAIEPILSESWLFPYYMTTNSQIHSTSWYTILIIWCTIHSLENLLPKLILVIGVHPVANRMAQTEDIIDSGCRICRFTFCYVNFWKRILVEKV